MNRMSRENLSGFRLRLAAAALALLTSTGIVLAEEANDISRLQISQAIDTYLTDLKGDRYLRIDADIQPPDPRLALTPCTAPLNIEHQPKDRIGGRVTFKVECPDPTGWAIRIPGAIQIFDNVVVAASAIPMRTQLSTNELRLEEMDVALQYRGYYRSLEQVRGFITKRPIPSGQVITPVTIEPPNLVSKGQTVAIIAEGPGIMIRSLGVALTDGALGEVIQVKNSKSNRVVEGRVSASGQIKVGL